MAFKSDAERIAWHFGLNVKGKGWTDHSQNHQESIPRNTFGITERFPNASKRNIDVVKQFIANRDSWLSGWLRRLSGNQWISSKHYNVNQTWRTVRTIEEEYDGDNSIYIKGMIHYSGSSSNYVESRRYSGGFGGHGKRKQGSYIVRTNRPFRFIHIQDTHASEDDAMEFRITNQNGDAIYTSWGTLPTKVRILQPVAGNWSNVRGQRDWPNGAGGAPPFNEDFSPLGVLAFNRNGKYTGVYGPHSLARAAFYGTGAFKTIPFSIVDPYDGKTYTYGAGDSVSARTSGSRVRSGGYKD